MSFQDNSVPTVCEPQPLQIKTTKPKKWTPQTVDPLFVQLDIDTEEYNSVVKLTKLPPTSIAFVKRIQHISNLASYETQKKDMPHHTEKLLFHQPSAIVPQANITQFAGPFGVGYYFSTTPQHTATKTTAAGGLPWNPVYLCRVLVDFQPIANGTLYVFNAKPIAIAGYLIGITRVVVSVLNGIKYYA